MSRKSTEEFDGVGVLTDPEAAKYLSLSPQTLRNWRLRGEGPPFCRIGRRRIAYRIVDLDAFLEAKLVGGESA